jgi:hypothetical protein
MSIQYLSLEEELRAFRNKTDYPRELIADVGKLLNDYGLTLNSELSELVNRFDYYKTGIKSLQDVLSKTYNKVAFLEESLENFEYYEAEQLEIYAKPPSNKDAVRTKSVQSLEPDYLGYKCIANNFNPALDMFLYYFRYDNFDDRYEILPWEEETAIKLQELAYGASQAKIRISILELHTDLLKDAERKGRNSNEIKTLTKRKVTTGYTSQLHGRVSVNPNDAHFFITDIVHNVRIFFNKLKQDKLIQETTDYPDFKYVFRYAEENPNKNHVHKSIMWMGTNEELKHLIQTMIGKKLIQPKFGKEENNKPWQVVQCCFINKDGNGYTPKQLQHTGQIKKGKERIEAVAEVMIGIKKNRYLN